MAKYNLSISKTDGAAYDRELQEYFTDMVYQVMTVADLKEAVDKESAMLEWFEAWFNVDLWGVDDKEQARNRAWLWLQECVTNAKERAEEEEWRIRDN